MILFWIFIMVLALAFGLVILFGAPYVPTLEKQREAALDLLDLKPGQILLDLGCGDGGMLKEAAERGLLVVGYELNPILYAIAYLRTRRYKGRVKVYWGNFWKANSQMQYADGIFVFLIDHYMQKLDHTIIANCRHKPVKLASFAYPIPGKKHDKLKGGIFVYNYKPVN